MELSNEKSDKNLPTTIGLFVSLPIFKKKWSKSIFRSRQYANHLIKFSPYLRESTIKVFKSDDVFAEL